MAKVEFEMTTSMLGKFVGIVLGMSGCYRNSFKNRMAQHNELKKECPEECKGTDSSPLYGGYVKYDKEYLVEWFNNHCIIGDTIYDDLASAVKKAELDEAFWLKFYQALSRSLEEYDIYTRADDDVLYYDEDIVEAC